MSVPNPRLNTPANLVELLRLRAAEDPTKVAYTHLLEGEFSEVNVTYEQLDLHSRAIAARLQSEFEPGSRALLLFPTGPDYIAAYFGCLYAGMIAVPVFPPSRKHRSRSQQRLLAIIRDARPVVGLTTTSYVEKGKGTFLSDGDLDSLKLIAVDKFRSVSDARWQEPSIRPDTVAFLQYTSGSIAEPKGVMVSHGNILHNERMIQVACDHTSKSDFVGWLPLYHDMGLIGNVLQPLYLGSRSILMPPTAFLEKPVRWLEAISRYRAETSGGPNFAYELCIQKIGSDDRLKLDLSTWRIAFNGAEPVHHETMSRFAAAFKSAGFRAKSFFPCYGLAESTLMVSGSCNRSDPGFRNLDSRALRQRRVKHSRETEESVQTVVSCGVPVADMHVLIVDQTTLKPCVPDEIGEIWISGPAVAQGYWMRPDFSEETFGARLPGCSARFLRSGDLGFISDGELFVTSRLKDLIIIRGQNYHPADIEWTARSTETGLDLGATAAFSVEMDGLERLVVVQEVQRAAEQSLSLLCDVIRRQIAEIHEINTYAVVLTRRGIVPKTSSGKVQRLVCRNQFLSGELDVLAASVLEDANEDSSQNLIPDVTRPEFAALPSSQRVLLIAEFLKREIAQVGQIPLDHISLKDQAFTKLGLDSLAAIELNCRISKKLAISLPLATLIEAASLMELAAVILDNLVPAFTSPLIGTLSPISNRQPLSQMQQALWYLQQVAPHSSAYNLGQAFRIEGPADILRLRKCIFEIVDRHPALRCTYGTSDQFIHPSSEAFQLEEETVQSCNSPEFLEKLRKEINRPINLATGPVFRAVFFTSHSGDDVFLFVVHHISVDLWSFGIVLRDLERLYCANPGERPVPLPPIDYDLGDYARVEKAILGGARGVDLHRYWHDYLSGELPALDLPIDLLRPTLQSFKGAEHHFKIESSIIDRLKSISREHGVTLYMVLLAAYQILLYKYTHQNDILVGSVIATRSDARYENAVGNYTNTLVVRGRPIGNLRFEDYLEQTRIAVLGAVNHCDYPFSKLVEALHAVRDVSRHPLFQAQFTLQRVPARLHKALEQVAVGMEPVKLQLRDLTLKTIPLDQGVSRFDLMLMVAEAEEGLVALLNYDTSLFLESTTARLAGHWKNILLGITEDFAQPLFSFSLLSKEEKYELLVARNKTARQGMRFNCLHNLIEEQVKRTPDHICVTCGQQTMTFSELDKKSNQLAHYLRRLGVRPETTVALCFERSIEMVTGMLGVLKAGGVYVPLDPAYPAERLAHIVQESGTELVLTHCEAASRLPEKGPMKLLLDKDWHLVKNEDEGHLESGVCSQNLAYILYTSGSTGKPNGIMISHEAISNHMYWFQAEFCLNSDDRVLQKTSFSFDASVWEFYAPLMAGGCLVMAPPGALLHGFSLLKIMREEQITIVQVVPSVLKTVVTESALTLCIGLRMLFCGGEALAEDVCRRLAARSSAELINLYGPTEATIDATFWRGDTAGVSEISIGKPIDGAQVYVLDECGNSVPIGVLGELYIGGLGLARGYLNQPELSAQRFLPNPFCDTAGGRLYRTGDVVRWIETGDLQFIGRKDHQIKLMGHRIELKEIEAVLGEHPKVASSVVLVQENHKYTERIVAYVKGKTGHSLEGADLKEYLLHRIPKYMIPFHYVFVDEFPLTQNGKLDLKALRALEDGQQNGAGFIAPRTTLETVLAECWAEILEVRQVGVDDNFFELGGHSLLAARLISTLQAVFATSEPLLALFYENPTVSSFAVAITSKNSSVVGAERAAEIFQSVRRLSEDQVAELLALRDGARNMGSVPD